MVLVEVVVALVLIFGVCLPIVGALIWSLNAAHKRTLDGKISHKRDQLRNQQDYINKLERTPRSSSPTRKELNASYAELAKKKKEQLKTELEALLLEKDRKEFEERMKRED